jgi:hypothetical protein
MVYTILFPYAGDNARTIGWTVHRALLRQRLG